MNLKLNTVTKFYFTECISGDISLNEKDITANMCPSDAELLYRINEYGVFYPVFPKSLLERQLVGYFLSKEYNEFICVFEENEEFAIDETIGDLGWLPFEGNIKC